MTDSDLVLTVPLARESAIEVGATSTALEAEDLEIAHVVWCATGHDEGDHSASWPVATYWPAWYARGIGTDRRPVTPVGQRRVDWRTAALSRSYAASVGCVESVISARPQRRLLMHRRVHGRLSRRRCR